MKTETLSSTTMGTGTVEIESVSTRAVGRRSNSAGSNSTRTFFTKPLRALKIALPALLILALPHTAFADTLIDNVQGITPNEEGGVDRFTGLVMDEEGRIKQVLASGEKRPRDVDFQHDGKGRVLIPGLIDSHLHVMGLGFAALSLDLSDTRSLVEAQEKIAQFAAAHPGRRWIVGRGWNQVKWGLGRFPTAADLDGLNIDKPIWLLRVDGHAGWANSKAMERAKIAASVKAPPGGRVERLAGTNRPSGIFVDAAMDLIAQNVPQPSATERDFALAKAQEILLSRGITAAADMGTSIEDWQSMRRAGDSGRLTIRIMAYASGIETMQLIAGPQPTPWLYNDRLRMGGVKLYLDGALGSRGAWLKRDYHDSTGHRGHRLMSDTQLRNVMSRAAMDNFQIAVHAIGDAANADALYAIDELAYTYKGDRRWRIEHAQIVDTADMARFGRHGVIASMQPVHQTSDRIMAEKRLDPARLDGAYAWRSIASAGARLAFGSDAPVESPDPFAGMAAAMSRTGEDGEPFGGWYPAQTVSRGAALAGYTSGAAYAGFAEERFGRIAPGLWADFVILDRDPMISSADQLRQTQVLESWVAGRRVYVQESGNPPASR